MGTAYNLLHPAVVEVNAWSESGHAATLPRHTPAGQEGIPAACENPSPTYFKQKRRIHPLSIKSSYPVRLMKNKSAKSHILSYCAGSALLALAAFSAGQAAAGVHAGEVLAHSRRRQNIHPVRLRGISHLGLQPVRTPHLRLFSRRKAHLPHQRHSQRVPRPGMESPPALPRPLLARGRAPRVLSAGAPQACKTASSSGAPLPFPQPQAPPHRTSVPFPQAPVMFLLKKSSTAFPRFPASAPLFS